MIEPRILVGASQLGWVTDLTHWLAEHGGGRLLGQALTANDVTTAEFDVLVVDGWSSLLSRRLVTEVQRTGAAVIVLTNPGESEMAKLDALGVTVTLPLDATPERIVSRATEIAAIRSVIDSKPAPTPPRPAIDLEADAAGRVVAVLGDRNAVELAVNIANVIAREGRSVVVIDFDTAEPAVATRLNVPLAPNLLTATDDLRADQLSPGSVSRHESGFGVIAGLANPKEWDGFDAVEAEALIAGCLEPFDLVVAVCDRRLEDLAPLTGLAGRFDVARSVVRRADHLVVSTALSPVGLVAALTVIADVRALTDAPIHVAADGPSHARFTRDEFRRELERTFTPASIGFPRFDKQQARAAWDGRLVHSGRYAKDIRGFARMLTRTPVIS